MAKKTLKVKPAPKKAASAKKAVSKAAKAKASATAKKASSTGKQAKAVTKSAATTKAPKPLKPVKVEVSKVVKPQNDSLKVKNKNSELKSKTGLSTSEKPVVEEMKAPVKALGILQKKKTEKTSGSKKSKKQEQSPADNELGLNAQSTKWLQYYKKYGNLEAPEYDMSQQFEDKKPIVHPKLGWGFVLSIVNDRLEVMFQDGIKTLISNYNPDLKL